MSKSDIILIVVISLIFYITLFTICVFNGINLCKKNNALGTLLLIIPLNVFGLILGICLIYNAKHSKYDDWLKDKEEFKKVLNNEITIEEYKKIKNIRTTQKAKKPLIRLFYYK